MEITARAVRLLPGGEAWMTPAQEGEAPGLKGALAANAVPGDVVRIVLHQRRRGVWRGVVRQVVTAGERRVPAACDAAMACGGCALQFLDPDAHAAIKSEWVREAFASMMTPQTDWQPVRGAPLERSRRRVRWHVGRVDGRREIGFLRRSERALAVARDCIAITGRLESLRDCLREFVTHSSSLPGWTSVQAVELSDGLHAVLEGLADSCAAEIPALPREIEGKPVCWWRRETPDAPAQPLDAARWPLRALHDRLPAGDAWLDLMVGPDDFVQGQEAGNHALLRCIQDWAQQAGLGEGGFVVDLFCGIGNLSLPLARAFGVRVLGAEANPASVQAAARNARALRLDASFRCVDLFRAWPDGDFAGADLMLLDPPRCGARRICEAMERWWPKRIVMVSCNPAAGARDGRILAARGWRLSALRALDLFPWSGHVEAVSLWERD